MRGISLRNHLFYMVSIVNSCRVLCFRILNNDEIVGSPDESRNEGSFLPDSTSGLEFKFAPPPGFRLRLSPLAIQHRSTGPLHGPQPSLEPPRASARSFHHIFTDILLNFIGTTRLHWKHGGRPLKLRLPPSATGFISFINVK
jgi:hypothetical protein